METPTTENKGPCIEQRILIENVIAILMEKEAKMKEKDYRYYSNVEFDNNNLTEFEELSNRNMILVKTKLRNEQRVSALINVLRAKYEKYFWRFDPVEQIGILDDLSENETYGINNYVANTYIITGALDTEYSVLKRHEVPKGARIFTIKDIRSMEY